MNFMRYQTTFLTILGFVLTALRAKLAVSLETVSEGTGIPEDDIRYLEDQDVDGHEQDINLRFLCRLCWYYGLQTSTVFEVAEKASVYLRETSGVATREWYENDLPEAPTLLLQEAAYRYLPPTNLREGVDLAEEYNPRTFWSAKRRLISIDAA